MEAGCVIGAGVLGAAGGWFAPMVAARVGEVRYGEGTEGYDEDDQALAAIPSLDDGVVRVRSALVAGVVVLALANQYSAGDLVAVLGVLALVIHTACLVDLRYLRLPNLFTYGAAVLALAGLALVTVRVGGDDKGALLTAAAVGGLAYAGFLFVVAGLFQAVRGKAGMGLGDVKLALSLGASVGWVGWAIDGSLVGTFRYVIYAALVGNVLGAVGGLVMTRLQPDRSFPFGPFLALGWLIVLAWHPA